MSKYILGLLCVIVTLFSAPPPALSGSIELRELGAAKAPKAFVSFCNRLPDECRVHAAINPASFTLTKERREMIKQTNLVVNKTIQPANDMKLHGIEDYWTFSWDRGDCEEYMLAKEKTLQLFGFPKSVLRFTVVLDEKGIGHAVLVVRTSEGDLILDNRRGEILSPSETGYTFLRWQSANDPKQWVELMNAPASVKTSAN